MCQKLWKLVENRQTYCNAKKGVIFRSRWKKKWHRNLQREEDNCRCCTMWWQAEMIQWWRYSSWTQGRWWKTDTKIQKHCYPTDQKEVSEMTRCLVKPNQQTMEDSWWQGSMCYRTQSDQDRYYDQPPLRTLLDDHLLYHNARYTLAEGRRYFEI